MTVLCLLAGPSTWCQTSATLLPKAVGAASLAKYRPVASLPAIRKLLGYIWLMWLPPLTFFSLQTGFVPKSHPATGVFLLKRAAELSREWGQEIFVAQLDLRKAFDRVKHTAAIRALKLRSASIQCIAPRMLMNLSAMPFVLGGVCSPEVGLERGLPQGAPESPLVFVLITELVLRPLLLNWRQRGSVWRLDGF